jgi:hypothetical protein
VTGGPGRPAGPRERHAEGGVRGRRLRWPVAWIVAALTAAALPALADEIRTPHFVFRPDAGAVGLAQRLAEDAEGRRRYVLGLLGIDDDRVIQVGVASDDDSMQAMAGTARPVHDRVAGLAISSRDLIVMSARGNEFFRARDTFVHELAHVYLDAAVAGRSVPRWFHEGFAMLVADERVEDRLMSALGAAATDAFLPLADLVDRFPDGEAEVRLAYAQSMLFVRFLQRESGGTGIASLLATLRAGMPFDLAFVQVFGDVPEAAFERFRASLDRWDGLVVFLTSAAVLWVAILLLFLWVYRRKRARAARKRELWALQEELARMQAVPGPEEVQ